jgi:hypothetical protein
MKIIGKNQGISGILQQMTVQGLKLRGKTSRVMGQLSLFQKPSISFNRRQIRRKSGGNRLPHGAVNDRTAVVEPGLEIHLNVIVAAFEQFFHLFLVGILGLEPVQASPMASLQPSAASQEFVLRTMPFSVSLMQWEYSI